MPRVVVLQLHGLDWALWEQSAASLPTLRERFALPVRVYGSSANTTSGARGMRGTHTRVAWRLTPPRAAPAAVQSVMAFMSCRQPTAARARGGAARPNATQRQATVPIQRAWRARCAASLTAAH